jgi:hypothetical protein
VDLLVKEVTKRLNDPNFFTEYLEIPSNIQVRSNFLKGLLNIYKCKREFSIPGDLVSLEKNDLKIKITGFKSQLFKKELIRTIDLMSQYEFPNDWEETEEMITKR